MRLEEHAQEILTCVTSVQKLWILRQIVFKQNKKIAFREFSWHVFSLCNYYVEFRKEFRLCLRWLVKNHVNDENDNVKWRIIEIRDGKPLIRFSIQRNISSQSFFSFFFNPFHFAHDGSLGFSFPIEHSNLQRP